MKKLNAQQTQMVSGGSEGIFYFHELTYNVECPNVSQACLDSYLSYSNIPRVTGTADSIGTVLAKCNGIERTLQAALCLEPIMDDIRARFELLISKYI